MYNKLELVGHGNTGTSIQTEWLPGLLVAVGIRSVEDSCDCLSGSCTSTQLTGLINHRCPSTSTRRSPSLSMSSTVAILPSACSMAISACVISARVTPVHSVSQLCAATITLVHFVSITFVHLTSKIPVCFASSITPLHSVSNLHTLYYTCTLCTNLFCTLLISRPNPRGSPGYRAAWVPVLHKAYLEE